MDSLFFRKATFADLESIIDLLKEDDFGKTRESSSSHPDYKIAFNQILVDANQFLMVVEKKQEIVGTCHLTLMPSLTFQGSLRMNIEAVRVSSSLRGQGIGQWMLKKAMELAQVKGCKIIQLTTNKKRLQALKLYEKMGFEKTHEGMKLLLNPKK